MSAHLPTHLFTPSAATMQMARKRQTADTTQRGEHNMASVYRRAGRTVYSMEFKDQHGITRKNVSSGMKDRRCADALAAKIEHDADRIRSGLQPEHADVTGPFLN